MMALRRDIVAASVGITLDQQRQVIELVDRRVEADARELHARLFSDVRPLDEVEKAEVVQIRNQLRLASASLDREILAKLNPEQEAKLAQVLQALNEFSASLTKAWPDVPAELRTDPRR